MARLFFALWPDNRIRTALNNIAQQFNDEKFRHVKKPNLHITLEFLGEISEQDQQTLIENVSTINGDAFELVLTRIGWWQQPGILWIGTNQIPDELISLVKSIKKLCKKQGLKTDKRPYKPHVTFARKVKQVNIPKETFKIFWQANSFVLVESVSTEEGVIYQVVKEWPLTC
ncbi:MAG: RNA 2',3'-cyclic phosphodiesterase [Proteobacteria bacterium]|nr:RNA 2',3'-cyclic phosphodiesterase [Pseudomonadota bacterium]